MTIADCHRRAAANVLVRSLRLRAEQQLLLFVDEASLPLAAIFEAVAREHAIGCSTFFVPRVQQARFDSRQQLPSPLEAAIHEAHGVFSALSPDAACTDFRVAVVRSSCAKQRTTVHAPGFVLGMLPYVDADYAQIDRDGQLLAQALVLGRQIEIVTYGNNDEAYRLTATLGGWERPPGISNGIIQESEWANLPPGETFVAPRSGDGAIAINGSLPGRPLGNHGPLVLRFEGGRCVEFSADDEATRQHFETTQVAVAEAEGDANWRNLAEIGFGVNPLIEKLWGVELVDEKMAGTVHIALGASDMLGGEVRSAIHCDLVTTGATVTVDGKPILTHGRWALRPDDWLLDHRVAPVAEGTWRPTDEVRRSASRVQVQDDQLFRVYGVGLGRRSALPVGNPTTAAAAETVYRLLPNHDTWQTAAALSDLAAKNGLDPAELAGLLAVMERYGLVRLQGETA